jgi:multimeric flavodoxin WrbA
MPSPRLDEAEFKRRYRQHFYDPAFDTLAEEIERIADVAWDAYSNSRKAPVTRAAGADFHNPSHELSVEWLAARDAIRTAQDRFEDIARPPSILIINGSSRSEHTCPGEMSKSFRMICEAEGAIRENFGLASTVLDLSRVASEFGRRIHPCKACFSTAAALCHWPCSCYPNHSLGQVHDWMNEIYPLWVEAAGIMIITPVNWYATSSPVKLMMDRLVCADGGNPDPTLTHGKDAERAKQVELDGWDYPRHLAGRLFSVVVHGDVEGAENVRRSLSDWLRFMRLAPAGPQAELDRYIGYWKPYATSHEEFDHDPAMMEEVRNAACSLAEGVVSKRAGRFQIPGAHLAEARSK